MSRYGRRAHVLADMVCQRLKRCCAKNPATMFIFTGILSTNHRWLNEAAGSFNQIMFDLSCQIPNLCFFDSHSVLMSSPISLPGSRTPVIRPNEDGVHITFEARRVVTDNLAIGIDMLARGREGNPVRGHWRWPLRPHFTKHLSAIKSGYPRRDLFISNG